MSRLMDIYGDRGSGKTILLAYFGVKSNKMNIPVIADYKLDLPNYIPLKIDELATLKYQFATVEFDEIDIYLNNRRSMSNLSMFINNTAIKQSKPSRDFRRDKVSNPQAAPRFGQERNRSDF